MKDIKDNILADKIILKQFPYPNQMFKKKYYFQKI